MPSPVLHTLPAVLIAKAALGTRSTDRNAHLRATRFGGQDAILMAAAVIAANVPDLDFVPGIIVNDPGMFHHGGSHSLFAAVVFGILCALVARLAHYPSVVRIGIVTGLAYFSHLLLDAAAPLDDVGRGVPFFWPLTERYFVSPVRLLMGIGLEPDRGGLLASLITPHNMLALGLEVLVVAVVAGGFRLARKSTSPRVDSRGRRE